MTYTIGTRAQQPKLPHLDTVIGCRHQLSPEIKRLIKEKYLQITAGADSSYEGTGGVTVQNAIAPSAQLTERLGVDRHTLMGLLASNDRLQLSMLMRWQDVLNIEIIDKKLLDAAWKSYLKHLGVS